MTSFDHERALGRHVAGVDEAGRGPLAGPVVAAAVVFGADKQAGRLGGAPIGVNDSKKLNPQKRRELAEAIRQTAHVGVGLAEPHEIDTLNIRNATFAAMVRAVEALAHVLSESLDAILIDGNAAPPQLRARTIAMGCAAPSLTVETLVKGDAKSASIAAASIIAKTVRDELMETADARWPGYGFATHAGYPTSRHRAALDALGPCPLHRRSFQPVRQADDASARSRRQAGVSTMWGTLISQ